jgi:hypothetical protein
MKTTKCVVFLATAVFFGFMPMAGSATLVTYDFPAAAITPTTTAADTLAGNFTFGTSSPDPDGRVAASGNDGGNVFYEPANGTADSNASSAITNNFYSAFTIEPNSGFALNLSTLTFNYGGTSDVTVSFTANFFVRSSTDGFAADVGTTFSKSIPANLSIPAYTLASIDLSGAAFQNLSAPVTFRIYAFADNYSGSFVIADRPRIDAINLAGTVGAIPEPSSAALMIVAGGMAGVCLRRRMRSSSASRRL